MPAWATTLPPPLRFYGDAHLHDVLTRPWIKGAIARLAVASRSGRLRRARARFASPCGAPRITPSRGHVVLPNSSMRISGSPRDRAHCGAVTDAEIGMGLRLEAPSQLSSSMSASTRRCSGARLPVGSTSLTAFSTAVARCARLARG